MRPSSRGGETGGLGSGVGGGVSGGEGGVAGRGGDGAVDIFVGVGMQIWCFGVCERNRKGKKDLEIDDIYASSSRSRIIHHVDDANACTNTFLVR